LSLKHLPLCRLSDHPAAQIFYRIGFKEFFNNKTSLDDVYQGKISELVVAQEIISQTDIYPSLHFWIREKGAAETDFIFIRCPIIYYQGLMKQLANL